jgi:hypothetical protein
MLGLRLTPVRNVQGCIGQLVYTVNNQSEAISSLCASMNFSNHPTEIDIGRVHLPTVAEV